jgi:cold shock CspA family protein
MGRSQESFNKKEVRKKREKKRKEKEKKRLARKETDGTASLDDMIAYVDENGMITNTPPDPANKTDIEAEEIEIGVPKRAADEDADKERKGVVSFFDENKGFGFIRDMDTNQSVFVHANDLLEPIKENNIVNFELAKGPKGLIAKQVKKHK